ncbi:uncharacterized protein SPSK_07100 [Sporothrix schenckii 1099-18]|uniref:Xylanolytic transcriptional activator regulatory domain-containing protein n=1 Tax=Sporothrix schenckii 1099-18 TaxID=1397361 RepID=A0A0F2MJY3_SPOSC|nr:uncharacterized protein SPSK_07100 [Sporothrix schenckii 1099-18]KJR88481.1 hypothetical protein SPSK_07100 [Sporothrix schenckii 1099-18]
MPGNLGNADAQASPSPRATFGPLATPRDRAPCPTSDQDPGLDGVDVVPTGASPVALTLMQPPPVPNQVAFPLPSPISVLVDAAVNRASEGNAPSRAVAATNSVSPLLVEPQAHTETGSVVVGFAAAAALQSPTPSVPAQRHNSPSRFPARNADKTAIYTLDDNDNVTAHSMGLAGEQDTELLSSFRAAIMNEADSIDSEILQIYAGGVTDSIGGGDGDAGERCHHPPVHFNMIRDEFMPLDNAVKVASSHRIEAAVQGCADHLVRLYFKHVHPVYPVLSKSRFLQTYADNKQVLPASLRGAVYGIASNFWHHDRVPDENRAVVPTTAATATAGTETAATAATAASSPYCTVTSPAMTVISRPDQHELFEQALTSLQRELHGPNLWTLQACLLLIHENSAENATIETPRVWMLAAQATACAQMLGLHRDPMAWQLAAWEKHLRRRLWWATFAADVWSSVCHGNPPHIYEGSFTTPPLRMEDVAQGEDVPQSLRHMVDDDCAVSDTAVCARFVNTVVVSRIVHQLLMSSFSDVAYVESMKDPVTREASLMQIRQQLQDWSMLLPRCISMETIPTAGVHHNNGMTFSAGNHRIHRDTFVLTIWRLIAPLHLSYYAAVALNFRALMSPVTKSAKHDPQSSLRRHFGSAIKEFGFFTDFMHGISPECLNEFWGLHSRSQLILCGNFLIYLFLLAPGPNQVRDTFALLGTFHDSLQRLSAVADQFAIGVLRPVALRIDSFFTQAAQLMRTNGQSPSS